MKFPVNVCSHPVFICIPSVVIPALNTGNEEVLEAGSSAKLCFNAFKYFMHIYFS